MKNSIIVLLLILIIQNTTSSFGHEIEVVNRESRDMIFALSYHHTKNVLASLNGYIDNHHDIVVGWFTVKRGESRKFEVGDFEREFYITLSTWEERTDPLIKRGFYVHKTDRFLMEKVRRVTSSTPGQIDLNVTIEGGNPKYNAQIYEWSKWGDKTGQNEYKHTIRNAKQKALQDNGWAPYPFITCPAKTKKIIFENGRMITYF